MPAMVVKRAKRVAVVLNPQHHWSRGIIRGIARYASDHGPWDFYSEFDSPIVDRVPPTRWRMDGLIAKIEGVAPLESTRFRRPVVNVGSLEFAGPAAPYPRVSTDRNKAGELAAEHLVGLGLKHFAWCGNISPTSQFNSVAAYEQRLRETGFECHRFLRDRTGVPQTWSSQQRRLTRWLRALPKPIGFAAPEAKLGRMIIQHCRSAGVQVPDEIAVIALSNETLVCEMCHPPLSSVDLAHELHGYEAAKLLDRMMRGQPAPEETLFIPPRGVIARQSTDTLAVSDPEVARSVAFIREHARDQIRVEDVLRALPAARRTLERRFARALGRTIGSEIRRVRLEHAKRLLADTEMNGAEIAELTGFSSQEYMIKAFRAELQQTPQGYRKAVRIGQG